MRTKKDVQAMLKGHRASMRIAARDKDYDLAHWFQIRILALKWVLDTGPEEK